MVDKKSNDPNRFGAEKTDVGPIRRFILRNCALTTMVMIAFFIVLSYYITYNMPEIIPGIEKWYKLLTDLCLGVIINFVFYIIQVYVPTRDNEKKGFAQIKARLKNVGERLQELILVIDKYVDGIDENKFAVKNTVVYYKYIYNINDKAHWGRKFDFNKDLEQMLKAIKDKVDRLMSSSTVQKCEEDIIEVLYHIQTSGIFWKLEQAQRESFNDENTYSGLKDDIEGLKIIRDYLANRLDCLELIAIKEMTLKEEAFFCSRLSTIAGREAHLEKFIPTVYMPREDE